MDEPARMRPLSLRATLGWAVLVFVIAQAVGIGVVWLSGNMPSDAPSLYDGTLVALVTLATNPVQIVLLAAIVRWQAGGSAAEYFGLTGFSRRDLLIGVLAIAALIATLEGISYLAGFDIVSPFQSEAFSTARAAGWVLPLALAIVVVGPVGEEILFRGFLFRGWVVPGARGIVAVVVIALLWAGMHLQYDWFGIGQVFSTGLVLGWLRWRSGSTALTIVLHMLVNLEGTIETLATMDWAVP
jgi:membrane protease YdiL (CAAX protease family)